MSLRKALIPQNLLDWLLPLPLSAPSIWGKLPAYGDFVHQHATTEDMQVWAQWFDTSPVRILLQPKEPARENAELRPEETENRVTPDVVASSEISYDLPWCFVLPVGTFPVTPNLFRDSIIAGVVAHSCDKVGRLHPLVVWQNVHPVWLDQLDKAQHWLFWLAQLIQSHVPPYSTPGQPNDGGSLLEQLNLLWHLIAPNFATRLRFPAKPLPEIDLVRLIESAKLPTQKKAERDTDKSLVGVRHLPWADWPHSVAYQDNPHSRQGFFWQQASGGSYTGVASLPVGRRASL